MYFLSKASSNNAGTIKTIKPKIFIINLNPNLLPSKGMMVSHNCLCWYYIKICKGLLSKTEIMLFAVKLENNSQDKIEISLSALLFISWFCFKECLRSNSIFFFWFSLMRLVIYGTCLWFCQSWSFYPLFCTLKVI